MSESAAAKYAIPSGTFTAKLKEKEVFLSGSGVICFLTDYIPMSEELDAISVHVSGAGNHIVVSVYHKDGDSYHETMIHDFTPFQVIMTPIGGLIMTSFAEYKNRVYTLHFDTAKKRVTLIVE